MNRSNRLPRVGLVLALLVLAAIVTGVAESAATTAIPKQLTGKWQRGNGWVVMTIHSNGKGGYTEGLGAGDLDVSRFAAHRLAISLGGPCSGTGTYRWKVANHQLKLTKIHDACKARVGWLAGTWRRSS